MDHPEEKTAGAAAVKKAAIPARNKPKAGSS
jgi:hypothetical protein